MKTTLCFLLILLVPLFLIAPPTVPQSGDTAGLQVSNEFNLVQTFAGGIAFGSPAVGPSSATGAVELSAPHIVSSYDLVLPGSAGFSGFYLCIGSTPGKWTYCGVGTPAVTTTPSSVSFGSVTVNDSLTIKVVVSNSGSGTLTLTGATPITLQGMSGFSQTNTCPASLDPGDSCTISVKFLPTSPGSVTGNVSIADNAAGSPQTVALSGTGTVVAPPVISSISPNQGAVGANIVITGTGFTSDASVTFSSTAATTTFISSTQLNVVVPTLALGTYNVTVSESNGTTTQTGGFSVTGNTIHTVSVSWNASTSSGVTGYNVYRGTVSGGPYSKVASVSGVSYSEMLSGPATYYYVITAVSSSEESLFSSQATAVLQ